MPNVKIVHFHEVLAVCEALLTKITSDNLIRSEHLTLPLEIFEDDETPRTIDFWMLKIFYDEYSTKDSKSRAFEASTLIDTAIRNFAKSERIDRIELMLKRKLTPNDTIRLLWVGDQGYDFARQFMALFIAHLKQTGSRV